MVINTSLLFSSEFTIKCFRLMVEYYHVQKSARDAAIVNLKVMKENYLKVLEGCNHKTDVRNKYVTTTDREDSAVRLEVVQSAINFLDQMMNIEQDETINSLMKSHLYS